MGICSAGARLIESLHLLSSKLNFAIRSLRLLFQMNVPKTPISFFIEPCLCPLPTSLCED